MFNFLLILTKFTMDLQKQKLIVVHGSIQNSLHYNSIVYMEYKDVQVEFTWGIQNSLHTVYMNIRMYRWSLHGVYKIVYI